MGLEQEPTGRELEIMKVLWDKGEATVREVYETLAEQRDVVQNTIQAFLRTMEDKGLVTHRVEGRSFIYKPAIARHETQKQMVSTVLDRVFDGAVDQLVLSALSLKKPSREELDKLEELIRKTKGQTR